MGKIFVKHGPVGRHLSNAALSPPDPHSPSELEISQQDK